MKTYSNDRLSYVTRSRARRAEKERVAESAAQREAGLCDCGLPVAPGEERCSVACAKVHKAKVDNAFKGL